MNTDPFILVVDDDPDSRELVAEILSQEGFRVETADDGYEALGKVQMMQPDLVVTDLEMPGMDGIELIARTREVAEPQSASPAIVMTAGGEARREEASRQGAAEVLEKPLDPDHLVSVVRRTLTPRPR